MLRSKRPQQSGDRKIFIDLADFPVTRNVDGKRIKVIRPEEAADLRSLKAYILSRIIVIIDLLEYKGDAEVAHNLIRDAVTECAGHIWVINDSTIVAAPYDVEVDNKQ